MLNSYRHWKNTTKTHQITISDNDIRLFRKNKTTSQRFLILSYLRTQGQTVVWKQFGEYSNKQYFVSERIFSSKLFRSPPFPPKGRLWSFEMPIRKNPSLHSTKDEKRLTILKSRSKLCIGWGKLQIVLPAIFLWKLVSAVAFYHFLPPQANRANKK